MFAELINEQIHKWLCSLPHPHCLLAWPTEEMIQNGGWKTGEGGFKMGRSSQLRITFPPFFHLDHTSPSWRLASFPSDATPPPPSVVDQHISTWNKCYFLAHPGFISLPVRENQRERGQEPRSKGLLDYSRQKRLTVPKEREGGREREGKLTSSFNQIETRIIWSWKTVTLFSPQSLALSGAIKPFAILSFHKLSLNLMFKGPWRIIQLNSPTLILLLNPGTKLMGD